MKCDFCKDRVDAGLKPACVTICTSQCLTFDLAEKIPISKRELWVKKMETAGGSLI